VRVRVVYADSQHLRSKFSDLLVLVSESARLDRASGCIVFRIEVEDNFLASIVAEMDRLAGRDWGFEVWGNHSRLKACGGLHDSVESSAGFMVIALSRRGATVLEAFLELSGFCGWLGYVLHMSVNIERARDRDLRRVWILLVLRRIA